MCMMIMLTVLLRFAFSTSYMAVMMLILLVSMQVFFLIFTDQIPCKWHPAVCTKKQYPIIHKRQVTCVTLSSCEKTYIC